MPSSGFDNLIASPLQRQAPCRDENELRPRRRSMGAPLHPSATQGAIKQLRLPPLDIFRLDRTHLRIRTSLATTLSGSSRGRSGQTVGLDAIVAPLRSLSRERDSILSKRCLPRWAQRTSCDRSTPSADAACVLSARLAGTVRSRQASGGFSLPLSGR